jgi:hypothetical protein
MSESVDRYRRFGFEAGCIRLTRTRTLTNEGPSIDPDRAEARRRDFDLDTRPRFSPVAPRPDSVAGHEGLELANVGSKIAI